MDPILECVRRTWGHAALRPLQREAIEASLAGRDALVVLPTGGGKSLCYQVPARLASGLTVVVSPLIALMKDQLARLERLEIPAEAVHSSLAPAERLRIEARVRGGSVRLLYVAPERFGDARFRVLLAGAGVRAFAIDEAHCISHWGHDFREAYGRLSALRDAFPAASVQALTATATAAVRQDISRRLRLRDPVVLVGDFFRPNLRLRVAPRRDALGDLLGALRAHRGEPCVAYVLRRGDADELAQGLGDAGIPAVAYHAGLEAGARDRAQDDWMEGRADVVVATVAFGMGIDRKDVRLVAHAALPQSLEHYQQETGRAGRDGRPAECVLFWSEADLEAWRGILRAAAPLRWEEKERRVAEVAAFCASRGCRHRALLEHFGQRWEGGAACGACDICEGEAAPATGRIVWDRGLYERLREARREIADALGRPPHEIASDSALRAIASDPPRDEAGLRRIAGVGRRGARLWVGRFLAVVREHGA